MKGLYSVTICHNKGRMLEYIPATQDTNKEEITREQMEDPISELQWRDHTEEDRRPKGSPRTQESKTSSSLV